MTPERHQKAGHLYLAALEVEPESRAAFLDGACGGDQELRREVEALLRARGRVGNYFRAPALEVAAKLVAERRHLLLAGQCLGHYRVLSLIGAGGMGEVYLAEDTRLGRKVALKLLPKEFTEDPDRVRRFELEARAASSLNHPNIVTIFEVGKVDGCHFIATEYIDGETLRERLSGAQLEVREALDVAAQIASALEAAHEAGIVHRDIKPENVMVRRDGLVKVLDFGLAKLTRGRVAARVLKRRLWPMRYDARGGHGHCQLHVAGAGARAEVDARTDILSLGVVLYEMVTGRAPFEGETPSHVIVSIMESEPPPLARTREVPAELERIVAKALRKEREERYQTASDLALDLKSLKQELEVEARLKRSLQPDADGRKATTTSGSQAAVETVYESAATTGDVATARTTSSVEYLVSEIKRHKRGAVLAAAAVFVAVAAIAYFFYPTSGGEAIDSVAVLPFVNASGDPNTEYLSEGISDSIINSLSRLPNLKVNSLNSVLRYKGKQIDPAGGRARAERPGGVDGQNDTAGRRCDDQRRVGGRERQPPAVGRAIQPQAVGHPRRAGRDRAGDFRRAAAAAHRRREEATG